MRLVSRKWRNDFKNAKNSDSYYDLLEDWGLIESSLAKQYQIRIRKEIKDMKWGELSSYISGIMYDTPLGNVVSIRSETNSDVIKNMTPEQKEIHRKWRNKQASQVSEDEMKNFLEQMKQSLINLAGGQKDAGNKM